MASGVVRAWTPVYFVVSVWPDAGSRDAFEVPPGDRPVSSGRMVFLGLRADARGIDKGGCRGPQRPVICAGGCEGRCPSRDVSHRAITASCCTRGRARAPAAAAASAGGGAAAMTAVRGGRAPWAGSGSGDVVWGRQPRLACSLHAAELQDRCRAGGMQPAARPRGSDDRGGRRSGARSLSRARPPIVRGDRASTDVGHASPRTASFGECCSARSIARPLRPRPEPRPQAAPSLPRHDAGVRLRRIEVGARIVPVAVRGSRYRRRCRLPRHAR